MATVQQSPLTAGTVQPDPASSNGSTLKEGPPQEDSRPCETTVRNHYLCEASSVSMISTSSISLPHLLKPIITPRPPFPGHLPHFPLKGRGHVCAFVLLKKEYGRT